MQDAARVASRALVRAGNKSDARMDMIATTTSSSMRVKGNRGRQDVWRELVMGFPLKSLNH